MGKKLYVGNLSYDVSSSDLETLLSAHGTVTSAEVISDRSTGQSKGFGFVEMNSEEEAQAAIAALNGQDNAGRALTVNEAKPREPRSQPRANEDRSFLGDRRVVENATNLLVLLHRARPQGGGPNDKILEIAIALDRTTGETSVGSDLSGLESVGEQFWRQNSLLGVHIVVDAIQGVRQVATVLREKSFVPTRPWSGHASVVAL